MMDPNKPTSNVPDQPIPQTNTSKSFPKFIFILGGLVILTVFITGGLFLGKYIYTPKSEVAIQPTVTAIQVITPAVTSTTDLSTESSGSATANWKIYENKKYGFSIGYPQDLLATENLNLPAEFDGLEVNFDSNKLYSNNQNPKNIYLSVSKTDQDLKTIVNEQKSKIVGHVVSKINTELTLLVSGIKAIKITFDLNDNGDRANVFLIKNGFLYSISADDKLINQILSTFKFLDQKQSDPNSYTACGCGCCSNTIPKNVCLFKSKNDSIEKIIQEDIDTKSSPQCSVVGCSAGITYKYCD